MVRKATQATAIGGTSPTDDSAEVISGEAPYIASVTLEGTAALLFHRWSNESVATKAAAAKGSAAKKTDDVESYVYRCDDGTIGIPGEYLRMAIVNAGRYRQDPRSPRKSLMDLLKAAVIPLTECATLGKADWDYLDSRRVTVQRAGVTRVRPAFLPGWRATFDVLVNSPEYVPAPMLLDIINQAGKFVGLADFRPVYGRFHAVKFEVAES